MTKTFKQVIDGIRTAVLGKEVREDIAQMGEYVEQFANTAGENIQKAIDPTLTLSGKAADAKETGDKIGELKEDLDDIAENNIVYKNNEVKVTGTAAWLAEYIDTGISVVAGKTYYLHIDSVDNCMTDVCAVFRGRNGTTSYTYRELTVSDVKNGNAVFIQVADSDTIDNFQLALYRNNSSSSVALGTTVFKGVRITTDGDDVIYSLEERVNLKKNGDFASIYKDNAIIKKALSDIAENNIVYKNDEVKVTGTAAWLAEYIDTGISVVAGKTYYLHIDSVDNCMTDVCAVFRGRNGTTSYTYRELTVSDVKNGNAVFIQVADSDTIDNFQLALYRNNSSSSVALGTTVFKGVRITTDGDDVIYSNIAAKSYWTNKKIVWFGTSIPAGVYDYDDTKNYWNLDSSYPRMVGKILGATVYNEAVSSSAMHTRSGTLITDTNPYGYQADFEYSAKTFSDSLEMKEWLIEHYNDDYWQRQRWDTMTETQKNQIRSWSWENKLNKYLSGGAVGQVDLYVFDHGFNDPRQTQHGHEYEGDTLYSFHGACNYLLKKIYQDNPKAKVVWLSHYTKNYNQSTKDLYAMQKEVCEDWDIHLVNLCDKLGWSNHEISISGHWVKQTTGQYLWVDDGVARSTTIKDANVPDGTHPFMDGTGHSNAVIAEAIAGELNALFKK